MTGGERLCGCGSAVPPGRRSGWCSSWCQAREEQGLPAEPPPGLTPPTVLTPVPTPPSAGTVRARRSVVDDVERRLSDAGLLDTWQAAVALDLAGSLDEGGGSGSARAALVRELRSTMAEALRGVDAAGSTLGGYRDELARRRERRTGGGSGA